MRITSGLVMGLLVACGAGPLPPDAASPSFTLTIHGEGTVYTYDGPSIGSVECPGACTAQVRVQNGVRLGTSPAPGWYFEDVSIDGVSLEPQQRDQPLEYALAGSVVVVTFTSTNPAPQCPLPPSLGPVADRAVHCLGRTFGDPTDAETILCDLDLDDSATPDVLVLELHDGNVGDPVPGTYDLAAQGDYASCLKCSVLFTDRVPPVPAQGDAWVATAGTMVIEAGEAGGHMTAHLDDLVLDHVTIQPDFSTPAAADGCSTAIWTARFDADIDYQPGVR
jgi:hypothetical protein